jgi:hypothetical protein
VADSILSAAMLSHCWDIAQPGGVEFAKPSALLENNAAFIL